jgi:hypothetical protein
VPEICANVLEVRSLIRVSIPTLLDKIVKLTGIVRWQLRSLPLLHPIFEYSRLQQFINWKGSRLPNQHCKANKSNIVRICVLGVASLRQLLSTFDCIHSGAINMIEAVFIVWLVYVVLSILSFVLPKS